MLLLLGFKKISPYNSIIPSGNRISNRSVCPAISQYTPAPMAVKAKRVSKMVTTGAASKVLD
jgi:hypothetical protein